MVLRISVVPSAEFRKVCDEQYGTKMKEKMKQEIEKRKKRVNKIKTIKKTKKNENTDHSIMTDSYFPRGNGYGGRQNFHSLKNRSVIMYSSRTQFTQSRRGDDGRAAG